MEIPTEFDWNIYRAESNFAKHGIRFAFAIAVFNDPRLFVEASTRSKDRERRYKAIGLIGGKAYAVVFAMVGRTCRIISARRTNRKEDRSYALRKVQTRSE